MCVMFVGRLMSVITVCGGRSRNCVCIVAVCSVFIRSIRIAGERDFVIRDIVKLAGMKDITGKIHSSTKNKLNNAKAVMLALEPLSMKYAKPVVEKIVMDNKEVAAPEAGGVKE